MVGSLIFLPHCARFDIASSVTQVATYMGKPTTHHLAAVKPIFRYLVDTPGLSTIYSPSKHNLDLKGFCGSSYGNSGTTEGKMRSTTGTMVFLANGLIHFSSSPHWITATSKTEAELVALARGGKFGTYLLNLLRDLGWSSIRPSTIFSDSQRALHLSSNFNYGSTSKHLAIIFYNLKRPTNNDHPMIHHFSTKGQHSDILAKYCERTTHRTLLKAVGEFEK
ncbi:unnamed protein product [Sphacelaria rigidula]